MSSKRWADAPKKNTSQWKKNESMIAKNQFLRSQRDKTEGLGPSSAINSGVVDQQYKDNYDQIDFSKKDDRKRNYRVKINGRYVDEEE